MCGGYRQGNGKGYCANSRKSPLLCAGDSGQTCLLCGRVKGGDRGCWARGCFWGEAAETLTEAALRNRASNVRSSHRVRARKQNAERLVKEAKEAGELRSQRDLAAASGLRSCLRAPGKRARAEEVQWRSDEPVQPPPHKTATSSVTKRLYGSAGLRQVLWWPDVGENVECDGCGQRCPWKGPRDERGDFQKVGERSKFARERILCPKCRKD